MEEWTRGHVIGRGSTATVSLAVTTSGELFAVKSAELSSSTFLQREGSFLSKLNSPYIVKYLSSGTTEESDRLMYNIVMEYVAGGTLHDLIGKCGGKLPESAIRSFTSQILKGLKYLHARGIVHCDVKSQNVLIGENGVVAKIADLGCAKTVEQGGATSEFSGTPAFMSPEVARGEEQRFAADVWAVGCTVIEMATGSGPWPELKDVVSGMYKIGFSGEAPKIPGWLSEKAKDFLRNCLKKDPKERGTVLELLQHPFLEQTDESHCLKMTSPCTVLDQDFWEFCETSESQSIETDHADPLADSSDFSIFPSDRIEQLAGDASLGLPNWDSSNHEWVQVRNDEIEETQKCDDDDEDDEAKTSEATEEFESSISDQENLFSEDSTENRYNFYSAFADNEIQLGNEKIDDSFVSSNDHSHEKDNKNSCFTMLQMVDDSHYIVIHNQISNPLNDETIKPKSHYHNHF